jgi:hypothetical protein
VRPDNLLRPLGSGRDLRHRNRGRVRREHRIGLADLVQRPEHLMLDVEPLEHGLDHDVRLGGRVQLGRRRDPVERRLHVLGRDDPLAGKLLQALADTGHPPPHGLVVQIPQRHLPARLRGDLRDPAPHEPCPDDRKPTSHALPFPSTSS